MASTTYTVPPNFPEGLNLDLLITEMPTVWPGDLFPAEYSANGKPGASGITTGVLEIVTPRALSAQEDLDALAHFQTHAGGVVRPGTTLATLEPPGTGGQGRWVFVVDVMRAAGPAQGLGAMLYDDGVNWRRSGDDAIIV